MGGSKEPPAIEAQLRVLLAQAYQDGGRLGKALSVLDSAVKACPACAAAHLYRGTVLDELGRTKEGIAELQDARRLAPNWDRVYLELGRAYEGKRDRQLAAEAYKRYLALDPPEAFARPVRAALKNLNL